jgi:hypothetical protein
MPGDYGGARQRSTAKMLVLEGVCKGGCEIEQLGR